MSNTPLQEVNRVIAQKLEVIECQNLVIKRLKESIWLNKLAIILFSLFSITLILTHGEPSIVEAIAVRIGGSF